MRCGIVLLSICAAVIAGPVEDDPVREFTQGNRIFTSNIYKELLKTEHGNFILSPFSAESILALTQEGAKGDTAKELRAGLSLPSTPERIRQSVQHVLLGLKNSNKETVALQTANKIYVSDQVQLNSNFDKIAADIYDSSIEPINFVETASAANAINKWVEGRTNNKIQNLVSSDSLNADTALVLVNALYFKGRWASEFEKYATAKKPFYKSKNNSTDVDMMHQVSYFNYYEHPQLGAKFLEMPYEGSDVSLVVILPNEIDGLSRLEQNIEKVLENHPFTKERVDVQLPRFKIETKIDFIPILKNLGIKKIFDEQHADLTGFALNTRKLAVSQVVQKAFINVDEAGTEAAAATAVSVILLSIPGSARFHFHVDHPFLYYIKSNDVILFVGKVREIGTSYDEIPVQQHTTVPSRRESNYVFPSQFYNEGPSMTRTPPSQIKNPLTNNNFDQSMISEEPWVWSTYRIKE